MQFFITIVVANVVGGLILHYLTKKEEDKSKTE
jgi:hypothetical protein